VPFGQGRVIDIDTERFVDGYQVRAETVGRRLRGSRDASEILPELLRD
jgi:hypothetical protein